MTTPEERRVIIVEWLSKNSLGTVMSVWGQLAFEEFMGPDPSDPLNLRGPIPKGGVT